MVPVMEDEFVLIKQGAEARLYKGTYLEKPTIVKTRFSKKYRHPDLDERLTRERTRGEVRGLMRAKNANIRTPAVYLVRPKTNSIYMEYLEGWETVNACIGNLLKQADDESKKQLEDLALEVGRVLGQLHGAGIIHGDLTTSNILVEKLQPSIAESDAASCPKFSIALIDFGLSHLDNSSEDKGVDLYVLERALTSTYSSLGWFFEMILQNYRQNYVKGGEEVYEKLEEIRLRGRKRTMVG